jgi:hypothetical protein
MTSPLNCACSVDKLTMKKAAGLKGDCLERKPTTFRGGVSGPLLESGRSKGRGGWMLVLDRTSVVEWLAHLQYSRCRLESVSGSHGVHPDVRPAATGNACLAAQWRTIVYKSGPSARRVTGRVRAGASSTGIAISSSYGSRRRTSLLAHTGKS